MSFADVAKGEAMKKHMMLVAALLVVFLFSRSARAQRHVVYSPAVPTVAYQPVQQAVFQPVVRPAMAFYTPAPAAVAVTPVYATRYRPILRGGISRVRNIYSPVTFAAPVPVTYFYR